MSSKLRHCDEVHDSMRARNAASRCRAHMDVTLLFYVVNSQLFQFAQVWSFIQTFFPDFFIRTLTQSSSELVLPLALLFGLKFTASVRHRRP